MQSYIFTKGLVLLQLFCIVFSAGYAMAGRAERQYLAYTETLRETLDRVNRTWNGGITYQSDLAHYGIRDKWAFPLDGYGDCEDYAIAKKRALLRMGIESFFALCRNHAGGIHIVLFVFTVRGALVLDNATDEIRLARQGSYEWLVVQFPGDVWRSAKTFRTVQAPAGYVEYRRTVLTAAEGP